MGVKWISKAILIEELVRVSQKGKPSVWAVRSFHEKNDALALTSHESGENEI